MEQVEPPSKHRGHGPGIMQTWWALLSAAGTQTALQGKPLNSLIKQSKVLPQPANVKCVLTPKALVSCHVK